MIVRVCATWLACVALGTGARADDSTTARTATLTDLFSADETRALSATLPADQRVTFRLRMPRGPQPGVLVFVKPIDSGEMPEAWGEVLEQRNLIWVAADGFGNQRLSAQRALVALMGLKLAEQSASIDPRRRYVAGMSGGGRVASRVITLFPRRFTGAIYIVGADPWARAEQGLLPAIVTNRYVFITGSEDFNRGEMKQVFAKYQAAGATRSLLMDLPGYRHEYPGAEVLTRALEYLDAR